MAGETPNAARVREQKKAALRKRFDTKTTDQYYRSGDVSVLGGSLGGEGRGRPGTPLQPIPTPNPSINDKNADKYYQNDRKQSFPKVRDLKPLPGQKRRSEPAAGYAPARTDLPPGFFSIGTPNEINGVLQDVCGYVSATDGATARVILPDGDRRLMQRVRAAVDLLTTREVITEDQGTSIQLVYANSKAVPTAPAVPAAAPTPVPLTLADLNHPPEPAGDVDVDAVDELDKLIEPAAVLAGKVDISDPVDTSPLPTPVDDDDDADNLLPPIETNQPLAETIPAEAETIPPSEDLLPPVDETPAPAEPKASRRGKRSGRGSTD